MTSLAAGPVMATPSRGQRRAEFFRIFNVSTVAVLFYLCLGVVLPRFLPLLAFEFNQGSISSTFTFLRQNLISGVTVLAAIAGVRALALGRGWSRTRSLAVGITCVSVAAFVSCFFRLLVFGVSFEAIPSRWPWA